jgi:hypothetical protein
MDEIPEEIQKLARKMASISFFILMDEIIEEIPKMQGLKIR